MIPEDDQIFTEVELNMLEKVINDTMVGVSCHRTDEDIYL